MKSYLETYYVKELKVKVLGEEVLSPRLPHTSETHGVITMDTEGN